MRAVSRVHSDFPIHNNNKIKIIKHTKTQRLGRHCNPSTWEVNARVYCKFEAILFHIKEFLAGQGYI